MNNCREKYSSNAILNNMTQTTMALDIQCGVGGWEGGGLESVGSPAYASVLDMHGIDEVFPVFEIRY